MRPRNSTKYIILIACLVVGTAIMFILDNYHSFWKDEFFQAICVRRYKEAPLGLLTFFIGHLWTDIFGFSLLNLRYLVSIEYALAVGVCAFSLYRITRNPILTGLSFLLGCVLLKTTAFSLYNWDSGTYLIDAIAICLLVRLTGRPTKLGFLLLGMVIGLMTLGRTPSVIFLPLAAAIVFMTPDSRIPRRGKWTASLLMAAGWIVCMLLLTWLILGSPANYILAFMDGNVVTGHSPFKDGYALFQRLLFIVEKMSMAWFYGIGCMLLSIILPKLKKLSSIIGVFALWLAYISLLIYKSYSWGINTLGADSSIGLGLLLVYPVFMLFHKGKRDRLLIVRLWAVLFLYVAMTFGSDAYVERIAAGFTVPLIIGILWKTRLGEIRLYLKYLILTAFITFFTIFAVEIAVNIKNYYRFKYSRPPFTGIYNHPSLEEYLKKFDVSIPYLQREGTKFAPIGEHIVLELTFGKANGLPFQEFQYSLHETDGWEVYRDSMLSSVDAFVYPLGEDLESKGMIEDIRNSGFTDSLRMGDSMILYRDGYRSARGLPKSSSDVAPQNHHRP